MERDGAQWVGLTVLGFCLGSRAIFLFPAAAPPEAGRVGLTETPSPGC